MGAEEALVQEIDEAQMVAAEAHEDASVFSADVDMVIKSAKARLNDHQRNANNAQHAHRDAVAQVATTQQELNAIKPTEEQDVDETDEQRATLEVRLKDLKQVAQEKEAASKAAAAAAEAAKAELEDLEARQKAAPKRAEPLAKLIRDEFQVIDAGLKIRQDAEATIMGEFNEQN